MPQPKCWNVSKNFASPHDLRKIQALRHRVPGRRRRNRTRQLAEAQFYVTLAARKTNPSSVNSGRIIRICLVGLPLGLILIGIGCIAYTTLVDPIDAKKPTQNRTANRQTGQISRQELEGHVKTLSQRIGPRSSENLTKLNAARFYLLSTLGISNIGYPVEEQIYEIQGEKYANIIAELPGTTRPDEIIIIGANYDSAPGTPGANDNATGVAAMLGLARAFAKRPQARTLRFVAFVNQEAPWFQTENMGSMQYARQIQSSGEDLIAMISLESMGYYSDQPGSQKSPDEVAGNSPDTGNFIAIIGNLSNKEFIDFAHQKFSGSSQLRAEKRAFPTPRIEPSDQWSFQKFGYPALIITNTGPHAHQSTDTHEIIDFERFTQAVEGTRTMILAVANSRIRWTPTSPPQH